MDARPQGVVGGRRDAVDHGSREAALAIDPGGQIGVDLTRRDLQDVAKKAARPWDWAKAFDRSAPCGPLSPAEVTGHPQKGRIWLSVNGEMKQDGDLAELIWPIADIVAICSEAVELKAGDLIFTGTPAGVGPLVAGDRVSAGVDGVGTLDFTVGPPT